MGDGLAHSDCAIERLDELQPQHERLQLTAVERFEHLWGGSVGRQLLGGQHGHLHLHREQYARVRSQRQLLNHSGAAHLGAYNNGFKTLTFTVAEGATTLFTQSFSTLSKAQTYFTDDPVILGNLTGPIDLTLTYKLTANAPEGAGISYLVADGPPVSSAHVSLADVAAAWQDEVRPHEGLMATAPRSSLFSAMRAIFDSAAQVGANKDVARFPGLRTPEPIRATQLIKAQRR
jgi:hypothetical protein